MKPKTRERSGVAAKPKMTNVTFAFEFRARGRRQPVFLLGGDVFRESSSVFATTTKWPRRRRCAAVTLETCRSASQEYFIFRYYDCWFKRQMCCLNFARSDDDDDELPFLLSNFCSPMTLSTDNKIKLRNTSNWPSLLLLPLLLFLYPLTGLFNWWKSVRAQQNRLLCDLACA